MRPLLALLAPHRRPLALALCAMAVLAITTGLYAWLVGPLLAFLFTGGTRGYEAFFALLPGVEPAGLDRRALTLVLPGVILAVAALKGVAYFVQLALMGRVGQAIAAALRRELFERVLDAERAPLQALDSGDLATRAAADVDAVQEGLVLASAALVRDGLTLLVLMSMAVALDWALALLAFVVLPIALFPIVRFGRRLRRSTHQGHEARGALASRLVETLAGRDVLRTPPARTDARRRFDAEVRALETARVRAVVTRAASHPIMEFLGVGGLAATLWFAAFRIWSGALDPAAFVSFFAAVLMLYEPLKGLSRASAWLHEARAGLDRLAPLLALAPAPDGSAVPAPLGEAVRLRGVTVAHGATTVLEGVSLTLERGTTTVLFGASGAGKTSLLRVVAGLAAPAAGLITWDALPYASLRRSALAARIGYLDQDALLFARSVRENLALGAAIDDELLLAALEQAGARDFVAARGGLDAVLVEGGRDLSGGQRRRLALARALAHAPDLLLLDEPTDAIDPATEQHILATLRMLSGRCTVLVVAHRPELIPWAEQRLEIVPGRAGTPARMATVAPASHDCPALLPA